MTDEIPKVEPIDIPEYEYKNSKYDMMSSLPARMLCVASSTGGTTVLMQNLILRIYRGSSERIYIFIPTVNVDDTWKPVKKYITDVMKVDIEVELRKLLHKAGSRTCHRTCASTCEEKLCNQC